ncbi:MAG: 16S rRNA (guanine(527)-N(7))-methyltransferase RsmG [Lachnospiraceae bacterium]|nr:16S rRNA (guanine(527)-N(7))-methyltransferase RsmG [Lachnospiraceae bacterium]
MTLINGLEELKIDYDNKKLNQTETFYEMLIEKNKVMNLTRITDREDFYVKHVLDSLLIVKLIDISDQSIIDIGTGAGFPGIPIKIFFPDTKITLLDSLNKRILFLNEVIEKTGLKDISTIHGRAEEVSRDKDHREKYDLALSRAVANMSVLSELCIPFVKTGGQFIAYKSSDSKQETDDACNAVKILSGGDINVSRYKLPESEIYRNIVLINKKTSTPKKYPRNPGVISKNPL